MNEDRAPAEQFSDEDLAFLRHVRFGELPPRVRPDDFVELVETETRRDRPTPAPIPDPQLGTTG